VSHRIIYDEPGSVPPKNPPLLMSYVRCPDCKHRGIDHPKRDAGGACIGAEMAFITVGGLSGVEVFEPCPCRRSRIGKTALKK
jgi:hypothetical protein